MAVQRQIKITRNGGTVTYEPANLNANPLDQIFWTNLDSEPHWPGLNEGGTITEDFFMPNQIAPGSSSSIFSPAQAETFDYVCSLHPKEAGGTITVTAAQTAT